MHDQNFKNLILDYPCEALKFFAGEEANDLDKARILPIRQERLKERLGERFRELDVPLLVEWPNGEREVILFVVEEESENRRFSMIITQISAKKRLPSTNRRILLKELKSWA